MRNKPWDDLKPAYRRRLENAGITRRMHAEGRGNLRKARGHARTPEHPGQGRARPEFRTYYTSDRVQTQPFQDLDLGYESFTEEYHWIPEDIQQRIAETVERIWGGAYRSHKFRGAHDPNQPPFGAPAVPPERMVEILNMDDSDIEYFAQYEPEGWFLWYH